VANKNRSTVRPLAALSMVLHTCFTCYSRSSSVPAILLFYFPLAEVRVLRPKTVERLLEVDKDSRPSCAAATCVRLGRPPHFYFFPPKTTKNVPGFLPNHRSLFAFQMSTERGKDALGICLLEWLNIGQRSKSVAVITASQDSFGNQCSGFFWPNPGADTAAMSHRRPV
jgi:hypothetical protein